MNAISDVTSQSGLLWFGNNLLSIPVSCADTADQMSVVEQWAPHGESPPMHVHQTQDELFVVLQGRLRLVMDGRDIFLEAGQTALAPKGSTHTFRVESADGAHFLAITRGEDFERMIRKVSRPAEYPGKPAPSAPTPEVIAALTAACAESGIEIVGPPLF